MSKEKISREIVAFEFVAPLKVIKTKTKDFILNLNNYRNAHYQVLNKTKVEFCTLMDENILMNMNQRQVRLRLPILYTIVLRGSLIFRMCVQ